MTETNVNDLTPEPKHLGLLAQFASPDELVAAAGKVTDEGYKNVEAFSPFAIPSIDEALKAKGTILPWIVLVMGLSGCVAGLGMQLYMNGVEGAWWLSGYAFQISAKPGFSSIPAFIPVTFETIILLSSFGAFFGMLILNKLPRLSNPLFRNERFAAATDNGFFLFIDGDDAKYAETETEAFLSSIGATAVEPIEQVLEGHHVPRMIHMIGGAAATLALLIPLYIWMTASTTTSLPRITWFKDMETQAKYKAQTTSTLFADGRAARKPIDGTVARDSGKDDMELYYGVAPESNLASVFGQSDLIFASRNNDRISARFAVAQQEAEGAEETAEQTADEEQAANANTNEENSENSENSESGEAKPAETDGEKADPPTSEEQPAEGDTGEPADTDEPADTESQDAAAATTEEEEKNWTKTFPKALTLDQAFMDRGQQRYNIHCAACHGLAGNGDGLVSKRAMEVSGASWSQPTSLHVEAVLTQLVGRIFDTISNGRRKMPGYREHISPEDRWAIVLYIQALQRSQNASEDDLPAAKKRELSNRS